jgi:hypothetical protein
MKSLQLILCCGLCVCLWAQTVRFVPDGYATINAAIDAAASGDTIRIGAGTYREQLVVSKDLVFVGAGINSTILREALSNPDSTIMVVNNVDVTLRGIRFHGGGEWEGGRRGVMAHDAHLTITQSAFVQCFNVSIAATNGKLDVDSTIISCINGGATIFIDSTADYTGMSADIGVLCMNTHFHLSNIIAGAQIDHIIMVCPNVHSMPVLLGYDFPPDTTQYSQGTIERCTLYGSRLAYYGQGIRVVGQPIGKHRAELTIRNNRIKGMVVDSNSAKPNNPITAGISFEGWEAYGDIYGNDIQHFNSGISFYGLCTGSVHGNTIKNNGRYGVVTSTGYPATLHQPDLGGGVLGSKGGNTIIDNGLWNIYNRNSDTLWACSNDWGSTDTATIRSKFYDHAKDTAVGPVIINCQVFTPATPASVKPMPSAISLSRPSQGSIRVDNVAPGPFSVCVCDLRGRELGRRIGESQGFAARRSVTIDLSRLSPGIYLLQIFSGSGKTTGDFMITR